MVDFKIEDFLDLVAVEAAKLVKRNPDLAGYHDDLVGAGHLKLVELRDRDDLQPETLTAYVRTAVYRAMLRELASYLPEFRSLEDDWVDPDSEDLEDSILRRVDIERYIENRRLS